MRFRLLGVPVEIQYGFWITTVFIRLELLRRSPELLLVWIAVVFVSILVHELGHALAVKRRRIEPTITLYWLGGLTTWREVLPVSRPHRVVISLAGPCAGFLLGGAIYLLKRFTALLAEAPPLLQFAVDNLLWVNIAWGLFNLLPVIPLDGGHVLESALGPRRKRLAAGISFVIAGALTLVCIRRQLLWIALLLGMAAVASFLRFRSETDDGGAEIAPGHAPPRDEPLPDDVAALLRRADDALLDERAADAIALGAQVLGRSPPAPPRARHRAHAALAWAHLQAGDADAAAAEHDAARRLGAPDPALTGALLRARGELAAAREVLEAARAAGASSREVVGELIRVLLAQGAAPEAAAAALEIVDTLSDDDVRRLGRIAFDHGAFAGAAQLYEAILDREGLPEDAYEAARARASEGNLERALHLLRRAVDAGFSDRARAWSDAALEPLRNGPLETVVPRP